MRKTYQNSMNSALTKMFNTNKDYLHHEIDRLASFQQRDTDYRRNGMLNMGALQMKNYSGDINYAIVGNSFSSTIVG